MMLSRSRPGRPGRTWQARSASEALTCATGRALSSSSRSSPKGCTPASTPSLAHPWPCAGYAGSCEGLLALLVAGASVIAARAADRASWPCEGRLAPSPA
eukprot:1440995-Alexandrium_andersonii.AAC.1